ncbi:MAG: hypothetical protein U1F46_17765 [Marinagarivorans sp.]
MFKFEYPTKLVLGAVFFVYTCIQGTLLLGKLNDKLLSASIDKLTPADGKHYDYLVAGGSNAMLGISAERIAQKTGLKSYNIAISAAEGAGLLNYPDWLQQSNSHAKTLIYSSMNLWYFGKTAPFEQLPDATLSQPLKRPLIETPLIRTISYARKKPSSSVNQYGDMTMFACDAQIPFFDAGLGDTTAIDQSRLQKFIQTVKATKNSVHADEIYVRLPPIYVSAESALTFKNYITYIHKALASYGIELLGTEQALTTDSTKMCFGPNHPTAQAREEYTDALIQELLSHKLLASQ